MQGRTQSVNSEPVDQEQENHLKTAREALLDLVADIHHDASFLEHIERAGRVVEQVLPPKVAEAILVYFATFGEHVRTGQAEEGGYNEISALADEVVSLYTEGWRYSPVDRWVQYFGTREST
jgi:hypothetical protein